MVIAKSLPALEALRVELSRKAGRVGLVVSPDKNKYEIFSVLIPEISTRGNHKWCNL